MRTDDPHDVRGCSPTFAAFAALAAFSAFSAAFAAFHSRSTSAASVAHRVTEHVGVAALHLRDDAASHVVEGEVARLLRECGVSDLGFGDPKHWFAVGRRAEPALDQAERR